MAETASKGLARLIELIRIAAGRIVIMAGGRIGESDLPALIGAGLVEIHVGSAAMIEGKTDAGRVRRIVDAARSCRLSGSDAR